MLTSEIKLSLFRQIDTLPDNLLPELQKVIADFLGKKKNGTAKHKHLTNEDRLKIITEAAKTLTVKEDFDTYMKDFEESTQDRPLPFRN